MRKNLALASFVLFVFTAILCFSFKPTYKFQDPSLSIEERVNDLVLKMTLDEKVGQMLNSAPAITRLGVPAYNWWNECLHGVARTP